MHLIIITHSKFSIAPRFMDLYDYQWYPLPIALRPVVFPNRLGFSGASLAIGRTSAAEATYYLFGGRDSNTYFNELWTYSTLTCGWSLYAFTQSSFSVPCGRALHVSLFNATGLSLSVFGGKNDIGYLNDFWRFDVALNEWRQTQYVTTSSQACPVSVGFSATFDGTQTNLYCLPGVVDTVRYPFVTSGVSSIFILTVATGTWTSVTPSNDPTINTDTFPFSGTVAFTYSGALFALGVRAHFGLCIYFADVHVRSLHSCLLAVPSSSPGHRRRRPHESSSDSLLQSLGGDQAMDYVCRLRGAVRPLIRQLCGWFGELDLSDRRVWQRLRRE